MKIEILAGSDFSLDKKDIRVEAGDVIDLPDKIAKALIKNNAAVKFDSKMKIKRARDEDGKFIPDDPSTPENEAWEEEE